MMRVDLPEWADWLDVPRATDGHAVRHRVLHGGRGGAKSWTMAHKLVIRARVHAVHILCVREYQNSIRDSSKKLIEESIARLGLEDFFTSTGDEIRGANGSRIVFIGLHGREASLKSYEGFTLCWVEEAATISQASIDALIPTIRRPGSEIWWSYNPRFATDPVDCLFRATLPPPGSVVVAVNHADNPWFPEVLRRDMDYDRMRDPQKHAHIWEGGYAERSEAAVFSRWSIVNYATPDEAVFRFGCDWGYARDPAVLVRCFTGRWEGMPGASAVVADLDGDCLFVDYEAYAVGCEIDDLPALFAGSDSMAPPRWTNRLGRAGIPGADRWPIRADSSRPELISYMIARRFNIEAATKGAGSIEEGISFLQNYDIHVHPRCPQTAAELLGYRWKIDRLTGAILPVLEDKNNHVIDALRYGLEGVRRSRVPDMRFASSGPRAIAGLVDSNRYGTARNWQAIPGIQPPDRRRLTSF